MVAKKISSMEALVSIVEMLEMLDPPDRQWVLNTTASKFSLALQPSSQAAGTPGAAAEPAPASLGAGAGTATEAQAAIQKKDARAFVRIKKPTTDAQRVACLGYYLSQTTGQHGFTSKDITAAHTDSGASAINMTRALDNATRKSKYLSNRGPKEKQLTTLGEDVVNALPDQVAVKTVELEVKSRRGAKKAKKGKKA